MSEGKRRILCAESNKDVGDLIALMLTRKGYEVETVQTAADCLKVASTDRFDLYILNDTYIDADSLELCRQLHEPAEVVFGVVGAGGGLGVVLDGDDGEALVAQALDAVVIEVEVRDLDLGGQAVGADGEAVVVRGDLDLASREVFHR